MLLYKDLNLNEQKKHLYDIRCLTLYHFVLKTSWTMWSEKIYCNYSPYQLANVFFIDEYKNISSN